MMRSIAKQPLMHRFAAARPALTSCLRAGLGAQALDFSTNLHAKRQANPGAKQSDDTTTNDKEVPVSPASQQQQHLQKQQQQDPWEDAFNLLWRRHAGFDDVFTRDPFFAPFFQQDPFERLRKRMTMMNQVHDRMMPVLRSELPSSFSKLVQSSPGYEIKETDNAYEIAMEVPSELRAEDLNVEVVQGGHAGQVALRITGERRNAASSDANGQDGDDKTKASSTSVMRFTKQFNIGKQVDAEHLQANFADGCLVVRAPKLEPVAAHQESTRQIPISTHPRAEMLLTDEELKYKNFNDAFDESDWVETGKRTTQSNV